MANPENLKQGQFLSTTQIYDLKTDASNANDFNVRLRQNLNNMIIALNAKVSGFYSEEEFMNGKLFYPDYTSTATYNSTEAPPTFRQVYQKILEVPTLPNAAGSINVPHTISGYPAAGATTFQFVSITGCASDQANRNFLPLPFASPTAADCIAVEVVGPNVVITVGKNRSTFTKNFVKLEYIKF